MLCPPCASLSTLTLFGIDLTNKHANMVGRAVEKYGEKILPVIACQSLTNSRKVVSQMWPSYSRLYICFASKIILFRAVGDRLSPDDLAARLRKFQGESMAILRQCQNDIVHDHVDRADSLASQDQGAAQGFICRMMLRRCLYLAII
ncbi:hypothetical protein HYFRA_00009307 [Hymenoscyphus fraxineus]|uniref:Uncharacterized protein n=1 Tax=Hymenoscyphus fraxineus TaxID=746836 RepID=A0A9N9L1W5_9HELO|nr:hypothetical protein HYFRA_00009307 [Hymenoscyphus fraxineus]